MKLKLFNSDKSVVNASFYNGIIVSIWAITGIVTSKIVAVFLGPTGLALLGNLRNFMQTASSLTGEGYQNGTIRYVAEFSENKKEKDKITATIFQLSLGFSILIGIVLWFFALNWSNLLFQTDKYYYIIRFFGFALPFFSFNLLIIYVLNGLEKYKKLVILNSVLSIGNMTVLILLVINYGLEGGFIGVILGPVLVFIINLFFLGKDRIWLLNVFRPKLFSLGILRNINLYLVMAIYSAIIVSVTFLMVRNLIIDNLGTEQAGYWEAMNRISKYYLMFFTSLTTFYLLPRLSKTISFKIFKTELKKFYAIAIPMLLVGLAIIYLLRFFLLRVLLSEEFLPTSSLFLWQMVGDFINVIAIALVKQFYAKLMVKEYLICNGLLYLMYLSLSYFFIDLYGLVGAVKAHALSYFIYLFLVMSFVVNYHKKNQYDRDL